MLYVYDFEIQFISGMQSLEQVLLSSRLKDNPFVLRSYMIKQFIINCLVHILCLKPKFYLGILNENEIPEVAFSVLPMPRDEYPKLMAAFKNEKGECYLISEYKLDFSDIDKNIRPITVNQTMNINTMLEYFLIANKILSLIEKYLSENVDYLKVVHKTKDNAGENDKNEDNNVFSIDEFEKIK